MTATQSSARAAATTAIDHGSIVDDRTLGGWLDDGLAVARAHDGLTFIAVPMAVTSAAALVAALAPPPIVTWTATELTIVGVGVARELRGSGGARWAEVIAAAHAIASNTPDVVDEPRDTMPTPLGANAPDPTRAVIAGATVSTASLGFARPRFLGGAAFAPGAASAAPWSGFGDAWFVLPRWTYVHDGVRALLVLAVDARDAAPTRRWHDELAQLMAAVRAPHHPRPQPALVELQRADAAPWRIQIDQITDAIARGDVSKVVAARTCTVTLAGPVCPADLLATLDDRHADCVRVMVRPPGAGALIAATPERLVAKHGDVIECDALAGSIARGDDDQLATTTLLASAKDRREHVLVVDAIRAALTAAGATLVEPRADGVVVEPSTRTLRHVIHLHTALRGILDRPRHVLELAARLHPTPAVGGTPTAIARSWIEAHEPAPRGWYASPVGWFDLEGDGELAVALRSGVIAGDRAHLWAGAGIVAGSDPDRELAETEVKLCAMLGALGVGAAGGGGA